MTQDLKSIKLLQKGLAVAIVVATVVPLPALAETQVAAIPQSPEGYAMMNWLGSLDIVEQIQTIHRLSQSSSPTAILGLITALSSPFPLARRKASNSLVEKLRAIPRDEQRVLAGKLQPALESPDPVVQKNMVRLMAEMNVPESRENLRQFFSASRQDEQLSALDALTQSSSSSQEALKMVIDTTPYTEVKEAASHKLK